MKESEVFFVSKEYEKQIKPKDFYDDVEACKKVDVVKEIRLLKNKVHLTLSHFNYSLSRQYELSEIYINNDCFKFNEKLKFNVEKYKRLSSGEQELILFLDAETFWKALKDEY